MFMSVISSKVTCSNNPFSQLTGHVDQGNRRWSYESRGCVRSAQGSAETIGKAGHILFQLGGCSACVSAWGEGEWIMLPPKIKTPLLASITQTSGDSQMSVLTLIGGPFPLLCLDLPISPLSLPPPHSLPSPSPSLPLFPFSIPPFSPPSLTPPSPSLSSHSLTHSLCSCFLPCPLSLSPSLTSPIFLHPSPLPPSGLQP